MLPPTPYCRCPGNDGWHMADSVAVWTGAQEVDALELVMPFLTDNPDWCYGFECGTLYMRMKAQEPLIEGPFHRANDEQIFLMASTFGYAYDWHKLNDTWIHVTFAMVNARGS